MALVGLAGSGIATLVYFVLGAQISGAGTAPEFLPPFWSDRGQNLPAGAGTSLLRDLFYFPDASTGEPIAILGAYVGAGLVVLLALNALSAHRRARAAASVGGHDDAVAVAAVGAWAGAAAPRPSSGSGRPPAGPSRRGRPRSSASLSTSAVARPWREDSWRKGYESSARAPRD